MNVFELAAVLTLDSKRYEQGLKDSEEKAGGFGEKLKNGLATAAKVGAAAVATVTTAATALGAAMSKGIKDTADYGDNVDKMSQKLGLSAEAYQKWDYVLQISGTSIDNMAMGMKTMTNQLDEAANGSESAQEKFAKLGISLEDIQTMSREDLFEKAIYGFQSLEEGTERAALANDLFGRSGQELTPLFNTSAEETQKLLENTEELGMVMSNDAVKAAAAYQDSLTTLKSSISGASRGILSEFLPSVTTIMDGLTMLFNGQDGGIDKVSEGINEFVDTIMKSAPKFFNAGLEIFKSLSRAILDNLPTVMTTVVGVISQIAKFIITDGLPILIATFKSIASEIITQLPAFFALIGEVLPELLPQLIDAFVGLIVMLAENFDDIILPIVDALPDIIVSVVTALLDNLPALIEAVIQLALGIVDASDQIIVQLLPLIPTIISEVVSAILENLPLLLEGIGQVVAAVIQLWIDFASQMDELWLNLWNTIKENVLAPIGNWINDNVIQPIVNFFTGLWENVVEIFTNLWSDIVGIWESVGTWFDNNVIQPVVGFFVDLWNDIEEIFKNLWDGITGIFENLANWFDEHVIQPIVGFFEGLGDSITGIWNNIVNGITTAINWIINGINGMISGVTSGVNSVIRALNSIQFDVPDWVPVVGGSSFGFNINELSAPQLSTINSGVYLDTGELVGSTVSTTNRYLARADVAARRGVY